MEMRAGTGVAIACVLAGSAFFFQLWSAAGTPPPQTEDANSSTAPVSPGDAGDVAASNRSIPAFRTAPAQVVTGVRGKVVWHDEVPAANVEVGLVDAGGAPHTATTDADGTYSLEFARPPDLADVRLAVRAPCWMSTDNVRVKIDRTNAGGQATLIRLAAEADLCVAVHIDELVQKLLSDAGMERLSVEVTHKTSQKWPPPTPLAKKSVLWTKDGAQMVLRVPFSHEAHVVSRAQRAGVPPCDIDSAVATIGRSVVSKIVLRGSSERLVHGAVQDTGGNPMPEAQVELRYHDPMAPGGVWRNSIPLSDRAEFLAFAAGSGKVDIAAKFGSLTSIELAVPGSAPHRVTIDTALLQRLRVHDAGRPIDRYVLAQNARRFAAESLQPLPLRVDGRSWLPSRPRARDFCLAWQAGNDTYLHRVYLPSDGTGEIEIDVASLDAAPCVELHIDFAGLRDVVCMLRRNETALDAVVKFERMVAPPADLTATTVVVRSVPAGSYLLEVRYAKAGVAPLWTERMVLPIGKPGTFRVPAEVAARPR